MVFLWSDSKQDSYINIPLSRDIDEAWKVFGRSPQTLDLRHEIYSTTIKVGEAICDLKISSEEINTNIGRYLENSWIYWLT